MTWRIKDGCLFDWLSSRVLTPPQIFCVVLFVTSYLPHVEDVRTAKLRVYDVSQQFRCGSNISGSYSGVAGFESLSGERQVLTENLHGLP
jgi:hypothetical protein